MSLLHFILNLTGLLMWLNSGSTRTDPVLSGRPASLLGTLRPAAPPRFRGWLFLAGLVLLLFVRAVLYWYIGATLDWTPRLNLFFTALPFQSQFFGPMLLFSFLSFGTMLLVFYFWILILVTLNGNVDDADPIQKLLRQRLAPVGRWPWPLKLVVPIVLTVALWAAVHPLLVLVRTCAPATAHVQVLKQGLLVGLALFLSLEYVLPLFLLADLITSYVYLGSSPVWDFVSHISRRLLAPLRPVPLRVGKVDFAPLAGIVLILLLLHTLPMIILRKLDQHGLPIWPL